MLHNDILQFVIPKIADLVHNVDLTKFSKIPVIIAHLILHHSQFSELITLCDKSFISF